MNAPSRTRSSLAALVLAAALAGCSASPGGGPSATFEPMLPAPDAQSAIDDSGMTSGAATPEMSLDSTSPELPAERSVTRTASLQLEVRDTREAAAEVARVAKALDGSIASQSLFTAGGTLAGDLTLLVPTMRLDEAMTDLSQIGKVHSEQRTEDDVTKVHVDLQARVSALTDSVARLTELLQSAETTGELIEAESALAERQQELDGLKAQLESLEGDVAQARIWVALSEPSAIPGGGPQTFWDALSAGFASIGTVAAGAVVVLGFAAPWILLAGLVALAIVVPIRRRRRARSATTAENGLSAKATESVAEPEAP